MSGRNFVELRSPVDVGDTEDPDPSVFTIAVEFTDSAGHRWRREGTKQPVRVTAIEPRPALVEGLPLLPLALVLGAIGTALGAAALVLVLA